MSTDSSTPERVTLTADQKRVLHTCPGCGHLLDSHDGSGCSAYDDESLRCTCDADSRTMETTYESVAALIAAREQALREEIADLSRWKEEALPVLDGLQEIGRALDLPLGERITGPVALAAVERLVARGGAPMTAREELPTQSLGLAREELAAALYDTVRSGSNRVSWTELGSRSQKYWLDIADALLASPALARVIREAIAGAKSSGAGGSLNKK